MQKTYNLEVGMPTTQAATARLRNIILTEKHMRTKAFKIIHGYGSTGTGGVLRTELRRTLSGYASKGIISGYIPGEDFSVFCEVAREAILKNPEIKKDRDFENHNPGITIVLL